MRHLFLLATMIASCWANAQNFTDSSGREWMRIDKTFTFAGSIPTLCNPNCSGVVTQSDYDIRLNTFKNPRQISLNGWTFANKAEVEALMQNTDLLNLGASQQFVTTYSASAAVFAMTSSKNESNSNFIAFAMASHNMVSFSYDSGFIVGISSVPPGARVGAMLYRSGGPAECVINGETIAHGATISRFKAASVAYNQTCESEVRTCTNGILSGTFTQSTCQPAAALSCIFDGQTYAHGQTVSGYSAANGTATQSCSQLATSRVCVNGSLGLAMSPTCAAYVPPTPPPVKPPKQDCRIKKGKLVCK